MPLIDRKFVYKSKEKEEIKHWNKCERYKLPFISVIDKNESDVEVFYDITNIVSSDKMKIISDKMKNFYTSYMDFLHLDVSTVQEYFDEYYFFRFKIKREFHFVLVEKLYDFLLLEILN